MAKNKKFGIEFEEFGAYQKKLEALGADTKQAVEQALRDTQQFIAEQSKAAMQPHNKSGETSKHIIEDGDVEWYNETASVSVGFDLKNGGLASIFLMRGTKVYGQPHITPDRNLYNAVYGARTMKKVQEIQKAAFEKAIREAMK